MTSSLEYAQPGWKLIPLREVLLHTIGGVWGASPGEGEVDVKVFRATELRNDGTLQPETAAIRSVSSKQLASRRLVAGDILLEKSGGGPTQPVGRVVRVPAHDGSAVCSNFVQLLRADPSKAEPSFLFWQLWYWHAVGRTVPLQTSSTNIRNLKTKDYLAEQAILPSLHEQRRIVATIEEQLSRLEAAEASLRSGLIRVGSAWRAGVASLVKPNWPELSVGDVADVRGGIVKNPSRRPVSNTAPFLRVANVLRGELDLSDVHDVEVFEGDLAKYGLEHGDLLVVEGNGSFEQIGRSAVWDERIPGCVHQNHLIRARPSREYLLPEFLGICWNSPTLSGRIAAAASSTSGLYSLSAGKVSSVLVPVPSLIEQESVVQRYEALASRLNGMRRQIRSGLARSRRLRMSLLRAAFRGELLTTRSDKVVA